MLKLIEINEENWLEFRNLSVNDTQRGFLDSAVGIIARGYIYRDNRARVIGIEDDDTAIGIALIKDLDEEPACYDLQQFMIDARFQGKGYGTAALHLLLSELEKERKYDCVEVCVKKTDSAALWVYEKAGFVDTGYIDEEAPDCLNLMYYFSEKQATFSDVLISDFSDGLYIGVDGCKGGWIAAVLDYGTLKIEKFESIEEIISRYPSFDAFLIDMIIGLRNSKDQTRPDQAARKELGVKASTIFPAPSRNAVYEITEEKQKQENIKALGKSLSKQTMAIIPKIRELDQFLREHPEYQGRILESHPELNFKRLNGEVVTSHKKKSEGFHERERILTKYLKEESLSWFYDKAKEFKCNPDDLMDAACLAVSAALHAHGLTETIPEKPDKDDLGFEMKLTVPKKKI